MKRAILLFSKVSVEEGMTHPDSLVDLLNDSGGTLDAYDALLEDLLFFVDSVNGKIDVWDTQNNKSLKYYDVVYFRYWGHSAAPAVAAARFCSINGIPFVDREVLRPGSQNKVTQYINLFDAGVPVPRTLIGTPKHLLKHYESYGFSFPIIMKSVLGTRGQDNFLVKSHRELQDLVRKAGDTAYVMQSFIRNDGDYRVLVMGDDVVAVIERKARTGVHLNNTSQGGSAVWLPTNALPDEVRTMCITATKYFRRSIAGVDVVKSLDDNRWYCFEVNRSPQIEHSSFESRKARLLADYLASL